jgi:hypothetical protein
MRRAYEGFKDLDLPKLGSKQENTEMTTRRAISDDLEMENLQRGDIGGAREAYRRAKVKDQEVAAISEFLRAHPEIMPIQANGHMLQEWCNRKNAVATKELLELALAELRDSLAMTPPAAPEPTAAERAAAEKKRLWSMSIDGLREEIRQNNRKRVSVGEAVSPEVAAMVSRADVDKLSAAQLRKLLYREGSGQARKGNIRRINELLQGKI